MRVLHIIDHMGLGGAQKIVNNITTNYEFADCIYCYVLREKNEQITHPGVIFRKSGNSLDLFSTLELKRIIEDKEIQLIHCHLFKSFLIGFILKAMFFKNIKLVFHEHGKIFKNKKYYNLFLQFVQPQVDLFIAVSEATKNELVENADIEEKKIAVLHNIIDLSSFNRIEMIKVAENIPELDMDKNAFIIGFAGRLDKIKGCEYLIKALPLLLIPNFRLLIAGEGREKKKLIKLSKKLNVKERTIFLGHLREMNEFYKSINVLVIPSEFESFGLAAIEAQACGVPVIASNVGGLNEIIIDGKNGLLFEAKNHKSLSEKIMKLYNNKRLNEILIAEGMKKTKEYIESDYSRKLNILYNEFFNLSNPLSKFDSRALCSE